MCSLSHLEAPLGLWLLLCLGERSDLSLVPHSPLMWGALWWRRMVLVSLGNSAVLPRTCEDTQWKQKRPFSSALVSHNSHSMVLGHLYLPSWPWAPSPGPSLLHQPTRTPRHQPTTALLVTVYWKWHKGRAKPPRRILSLSPFSSLS